MPRASLGSPPLGDEGCPPFGGDRLAELEARHDRPAPHLDRLSAAVWGALFLFEIAAWAGVAILSAQTLFADRATSEGHPQ